MEDYKSDKIKRRSNNLEKQGSSEKMNSLGSTVKGVGGVGGDGALTADESIAEFLKLQRESMNGMSEEEFNAKFEAHMKLEPTDKKKTIGRGNRPPYKAHESVSRSTHVPDSSPPLTSIVLKFTTLSDNNSDAPSYVVGTKGATIGKLPTNDISVVSDARLAPTAHAVIEFNKGHFYLVDGGYEYAASVRISVGTSKRQWVLDADAKFSAGNSVFRSCGTNSDGLLVIEITGGPLKGERRVVTKKGASIGRSSDNTIAVPDRELSRKHTKIQFDETSGTYFVCDVGSTNGTYVQLTGPFGGKFKLSLNDHILVGRTGFSVNRFDFGLSEEMGRRQTMEDSSSVIQCLNIPGVGNPLISPQSFFAVFDGHGGSNASAYLAQYLHINIAEGLTAVAEDINAALAGLGSAPSLPEDGHAANTALNSIITKSLKESFLKTDANFISSSQHAQNGSTATTAFIVGNRLYCANVGDSRTVLCRKFLPVLMSHDHKPSREDESRRIREAGGFVVNNRVMGELAVSRAFGDSEFKKGIQSIIEEEGVPMPAAGGGEEVKNWDQPLIIAEPDIEITNITADDQFLLLACDGLFDVFSSEEAVAFVKDFMEKSGDAQKCCQTLCHEAIKKRNSSDNVSVILVILNKWY